MDGQLRTSWMFLIRVNCKVGMKWATVEEEKGVNMLLKSRFVPVHARRLGISTISSFH